MKFWKKIGLIRLSSIKFLQNSKSREEEADIAHQIWQELYFRKFMANFETEFTQRFGKKGLE